MAIRLKGKMLSMTAAQRESRCVESYKNAAEAIGPITHGMAVFGVTRGQWCMIDAVSHVVNEMSPCTVSLWTWRVSSYDLGAIFAMHKAGKITSATLILDALAMRASMRSGVDAATVDQFREVFGANSVKHLINHAKIVAIEGRGMRVVLRGSMNLNGNPRMEQFDISEGGPAFAFVKRLEADMPVVHETAPVSAHRKASKVGSGGCDLFGGEKLRRWEP